MDELKSLSKSLQDVLQSRLGFLLNEVLKSLRFILDDTLKEIGISSRHLGVLLVLRHQGSLTQKEIAQALRIDRTTMGLLTSELEKLKFLNRSVHPDDKRCNKVTLTAAGLEAADKGYALAVKEQENFLSVVSVQDWAELKRILTLLYTAHCSEQIGSDS